MMFTCIRRLAFRWKKPVVISILGFASVILILRFQFHAIEAISGQRGDLVVQTSYGHAEVVTRSAIVEGDFRAAHKNVEEREELSERETAEEIRLPCTEPQEKPGFREIVKETLVYSVWFDDRKSQHFIRILLLNSKYDGLPLLSCGFESVAKQNVFTSEASQFYEHNENHGQRFGTFIASCIVPKELDRIPCFVNITVTSANQNERNSVVFPVGFVDRQRNIDETSGAKYGICIPPVHGVISVERLVEFLELSQILGASHFTFYDFEMTDRVRYVLNYYQSKGLVSVLAWNFPPYIAKDNVHYFGQVLSIMDCLYRSMKHLHFVAFHDLDEFIVPLRHDNITAMMKEIHKEEHCGHCFQSVVFDPSRNQASAIASPFLTQRVIFRTSQASPLWTKCIVDPRRIFEQGIHHISKPIEEYYHADKVDWNIALVFHYRKCHDSRAAMQPKCFVFEVDKTMQKFGQKLMHNFQNVINFVN